MVNNSYIITTKLLTISGTITITITVTIKIKTKKLDLGKKSMESRSRFTTEMKRHNFHDFRLKISVMCQYELEGQQLRNHFYL